MIWVWTDINGLPRRIIMLHKYRKTKNIKKYTIKVENV